MAVGTHSGEFVYDRLPRTWWQVEKENGITTSDERVLRCETAISGDAEPPVAIGRPTSWRLRGGVVLLQAI